MKSIKYTIIILILYVPILKSQCSPEIDPVYACDTLQTKQLKSNYTEYYKQAKETKKIETYKDAYQGWKWLLDNAPKSTKNLYINGPKILKALIEKEEDEDEKNRLIDLLISVYDIRLDYYPEKEGYVRALQGKDMYKYRSSTVEGLKKCRAVCQKSIQIDGLNSLSTAILYYFKATKKLFTEKVIDQQELMTLFSDVSEIADYRQASISQEIYQLSSDSTKELSSKEKKSLSKLEMELGRINSAKKQINKSFESIIKDCETLIALYQGFDRFTINQKWIEKEQKYNKTYTDFKSSGDSIKDLKWLNRTAEVFIKKGCMDNDLYLQVVTLLYDMNPTAESAFKMGQRKYAKKSYSEAIAYFEDAYTQEVDDNIKKSKYAFYTAAAAARVRNNRKARNYALKAANLRKNWGDPYMLIGKLYAQSSAKCGDNPATKKAGYWAAIEKFQLAKRIDKSCESEANKLIGEYGKLVPTLSVWKDNVGDPKKTYTIDCWYTENVRIKF